MRDKLRELSLLLLSLVPRVDLNAIGQSGGSGGCRLRRELSSNVSAVWVEDYHQWTDPDPVVALQGAAPVVACDADTVQQKLMVVQRPHRPSPVAILFVQLNLAVSP
jgi:hypothetical protein